MSSYSEKLLINCVHADPGSCMCIIYFLDLKCETFSLLANTHDPENRSQKLNKIHRRRLSHWNCHADSLTCVAISHHCHQALPTMLPMIHWQSELFYGHQSCSAGQSTEATHLAAKWPLSDRFMSIPTTFSVIQMDERKSRKHMIGQQSLYPNLNLVVEKLLSKLQRLKQDQDFLLWIEG